MSKVIINYPEIDCNCIEVGNIVSWANEICLVVKIEEFTGDLQLYLFNMNETRRDIKQSELDGIYGQATIEINLNKQLTDIS